MNADEKAKQPRAAICAEKHASYKSRGTRLRYIRPTNKTLQGKYLSVIFQREGQIHLDANGINFPIWNLANGM